jgi:hypothetical protein
MPQSPRPRGPSQHYPVDLQQQLRRNGPSYHRRHDQHDPPCRSDSTTRPLSSHRQSHRADLCQAPMAHPLQSQRPPDRTSMLSWRRSPSPELWRSVSYVAISRVRTTTLQNSRVSHYRRRMLAILPRCFVILSHRSLIRRGLSLPGCTTMSITTSRTSGLVPSSRQHLREPSRVDWYV